MSRTLPALATQRPPPENGAGLRAMRGALICLFPCRYKTVREIVTLERMHRAFADGLMEYGMMKVCVGGWVRVCFFGGGGGGGGGTAPLRSPAALADVAPTCPREQAVKKPAAAAASGNGAAPAEVRVEVAA